MATVTGMTASATQAALDGKVDKTTSILTGSGLTGGGDLSSGRTISLDATVLRSTNNLNDVADKPTARSNMNLAQRPVFDVRDYLAVGNGIADDTIPISNAITAAAAVSGGTVYIPPGYNCKITSGLIISTSGITISGGGSGSRISYDGSVVATAISASGNIRIFIRDLRISQTNASHVGTAIDLSQTNCSVVEQVLIDAGGASGVAPKIGVLMNATTCHYNVVCNSRINYGGTSSAGVKIIGSSHSNTVQDVRLISQGDDSASSGIYINNSHSTTIIHPDIEGAVGNGIWLDTSADSTSISNAYCESNNIGLKISSGVIAPVVIGGTYQSSTTANIQDNGAISPIILNAWPNSGTSSYSHIDLTNVDKFYVNGVPIPASTYQASDHGYVGWTFDPALVASSFLTASGTVYLAQVNVRTTKTVSKVHIGIGTAASGVVANQNFLALIDSTGAVVDKTVAGAIDAGLAATGVLQGTLTSSHTLAPGVYWVAFLNNATTPAQVYRSGSFTVMPNANLAASQYRYCVNGVSKTTFPASFTPGSNTLTNATTMWAAIL
jgi:hypothetical protein